MLELCPYKGLAAFEAADAPNFFGRERLVAELVARLAGAPLLAVIGPSGSGKSSLVRAGLLPALDAGVIPVTDGWCSLIVAPGARPAGTLSAQLSVAGQVAGRRVVFIDQFEEAFTLGSDDAAQAGFVAEIVDLAARSDTVVVLAVRADHVGRCAARPELADLMSGNEVLVGPMREAELRRAIELPARRAGLTVEAGLVDVIVSDVAGRPGALPLLSTALAETWERRAGRTLTLAGYRAAGGVNGALARMAEDAYLALGEGARAAARRVLLRLSDAGEDGAVDLRRRLPLGEVVGGDDDAGVAVEALVARRLVTVDGDSVEVAHEALLREWPRLRAWLDEDVQGRRLHRRISAATRAWRAAGDDPSELYRGTRLDAALEWAGTHLVDLNETERTFLDASRQQAEREMAEARRRAADKARANRRLRMLLGGVAVLLVVALVSGVLFLRQRNRAQRATLDATARELAGQSGLALAEDAELGILLALEAVETTETPLPEAVGALQQAVQASRVELRGDDGRESVAVSPDGRLIVTDSAHEGDSVIIWDATTGEPLRMLTGPSQVGHLAISPDGDLVAVSYAYGDGDATPQPAIVLWDIASGSEVNQLMGPAAQYFIPAFSPDGRLVATSSIRSGEPDRVTVWDARSGRELLALDVEFDGNGAVVFTDDDTFLVAERDNERVGLYSVDDRRELGALPTPGFKPEIAALDPTGQRLALAAQFSGVQVWDLPNRQLLRTIPIPDVWKVEWSPDGAHLALSGGNQSSIRIVDASSGADVLTLQGHQSGSADVAYTPDGARLASVEIGGGLRVWDVTPDGSPELGGLTLPAGEGGTELYVSPDGSEVMVVRDGVIRFVATDTGDARTLDGQLAEPLSYRPTPSPDWRWIGSVEADGQPQIRAIDTLAPVAELPPCTSPVAFSPDRSLVALDGYAPCGLVSDARSFEAPPGAVLRSRVIEVGSGREVLDLGARAIGLGTATFNPGGAFPGGRYLAVNVATEDLQRAVGEIYDVATGELVARLDIGDLNLYWLAFDPQGRWLAASMGNGELLVFDFAAIVEASSADDALIMRRVTHQGALRPSDVNADGIVATAGTGGGLIRLWDLSSGEETVELRFATKGFWSVAFDHDARDLLYLEENVMRRYPLDTDELIELARSRLTRDFTPDECVRYLGPGRCP